MQPNNLRTFSSGHQMGSTGDESNMNFQKDYFISNNTQKIYRNRTLADQINYQPATIVVQPDPRRQVKLLYSTSVRKSNSQNLNDQMRIFEKNLQLISNAMVEQMSKSISQITRAQIQLFRLHQQVEEPKMIKKQTKQKLNSNLALQRFSTLQVCGDQRYEGESLFTKQMNSIDGKKNFKKLKSHTQSNYNSIQNQSDPQNAPNYRQFLRQIKLLNQNKKQPRLLWMDIDLGQLPPSFNSNLQAKGNNFTQNELKKMKKIKIHFIKEKVFQIISQIISVSFNLHYKQGVQYQKVKAYCSENFIVNFCKLVKLTDMTAQQMKLIQQTLQVDILPYLNLSYPRSEQKTVNKQLKRRIDQKDIFNQNRFDIVYNSKVKMTTKHADTNNQIMSIMNYMIKLPDQESPDIRFIPPPNQKEQANNSSKLIQKDSQLGKSSKAEVKYQQKKTLYENFQKDMQLILSIVYSQELVDRLYRLTPEKKKEIAQKQQSPQQQPLRNIQQILNLINTDLCEYDYRKINNSKRDKKQKEEQQYKDMVQSYTKFKIGRKIPSHVQTYSQSERSQPSSMSIKDSSVARILMKWTQALQSHLQDPAKSLYLRDEPYRLHNQQETYQLSSEKHIKKMFEFFERSNSVVKQKSQQLKKNARQIFLQALRYYQTTKFQSYKTFSSKNDALVGHICTLVQKSKVNHITSYLNMIIAQYKSIEQQYQWLIQDKKVQIGSSPSLVTLKLGDLMRCQIISKTKQIISLYQYISILCKRDPQRFQLVRVKDRSSTPNKDILINIFYHKAIMIQIQLAIKNDSAFLNCSDKFSHFIYEMQRSFLGPVNQICAIWSQFSPKYEFFANKFTQINIRGTKNEQISPQERENRTKCQNKKSHEFRDQQKSFKLPFWCHNCGVFYPNSSSERKVCAYCNKVYCSVCDIQEGLNAVKIMDRIQFSDYEPGQEGQLGFLYYAIDLSRSNLWLKTVIKIQINGKIEVFSMKVTFNKNYREQYINSTPNITNPNILDKNIDIFSSLNVNAIGNSISSINSNSYNNYKKATIRNHSQKYIIENINQQYKVNKKNQKTSYQEQLFRQNHLILQKKKRNQQQDKQLIDQIVRQILAKYTLPRRFNFIIKKSQSFIKLTLNTNPQTQQKGPIITECLQKNIKKLKQIQKINLNQCHLRQVKFFTSKSLPKLQNLVLNKNQISTIDLTEFKQLICLELAYNQIVSIDQLFYLETCKKLQRLVLDYNHLKDLDGLKNLPKLNFLSLQHNQITTLTKMNSFNQLKYLNLNANNLQDLGSTMLIENLVELKLNKNPSLGINGVQNLKNLKKLRRLHINSIQLKAKLCQSLDFRSNINLTNTTRINIQNSVQQLRILNSLSELQFMSATRNQLKIIPKLQSLSKLRQLDLYDNNLQSIKEIQHFKNLQWLCLRKNKIISLDGLAGLKNIYWLNLSGNKLNQSCFKYINQLTHLQELGLNYNLFNTLEDMAPFQKLYQLKIKDNKVNTFKGIQNLKNLDFLDASYNKLSDLNGIQNLKYLRELKISGNASISCLQKSLKQNQNLKILVFNDGNINDIDNQIPKMKNLQQLYLRNNCLADTKGINKLQSLKKLDISHNKISNLDGLKELKYLNTLIFSFYPSFKKIQQSLKGLQSVKIQINIFAVQTILNYITGYQPPKTDVLKQEDFIINIRKVQNNEMIEKRQLTRQQKQQQKKQYVRNLQILNHMKKSNTQIRTILCIQKQKKFKDKQSSSDEEQHVGI